MPIKSVIELVRAVFLGLSQMHQRELIYLFSFFFKSKNDKRVSYINEECNDPEPRELRCLDL